MNEYPSIDLCKKIEKWMPDTRFYWCRMNKPTFTCWDVRGNKFVDEFRLSERKLITIKAPSIHEMLEVMPKIIVRTHGRYVPRIEPDFFIDDEHCGGWNVTFYDTDHILCSVSEESLPNALADCIQWLGENGYIKECMK